MCGRFTLRTSTPVLARTFRTETVPDLRPRYNIAPTQQVPIIRAGTDEGGRQWQSMHWGLIPSWAKEPSIGSRMINARSETAAEKPSFRTALRRRRCLVPADGYYEWQRVGKKKLPFYIRMHDDRPFAMAGLWESWREKSTGASNHAAETSPLLSFTILTTSSNDLTADLHDRMPVILSENDWEQWLDSQEADDEQVAELKQLMTAFPAEEMQLSPVSTFVNNARHEGPECIDAV